MKSGEHYFAFISYSRKDYDIARAIWRRLESFRYPSRVERQYRPRGTKYVREIFFDRTKLDCSNEDFKKGIYEALVQSRYLIVLCSPNSAAPNEVGNHWVDDEISYFLSQHGGNADLVVPVLLNGDIRNLPPAINTEDMRSRNNPICLQEEDSIDVVVAQILNYLFHLPLPFLLSRLNSQRLRFFRRVAAIGVGLSLVFSIMAFGMFVLKARADRNRRLADENACEAKRQAERATSNAKEAQRQAEIAQRNAAMADHERKLAMQSLDFMVDTFQMSDPLNAGQCDVKMVDALKARVPDIARLEPWELRADVGCKVGAVLHNVGMFHEATNLLFATMALNQSKRPKSPETAYNLYCLSWCFFKDMADTISALAYAQKALEIYENAPRQDRLKIALACNAMGVFYIYRDEDLDKAKMYLNRAFAIRYEELGANHVDVAVVCCNLGHLYMKERSFELAGKAYSQALQIYEHNGKASHIGSAKAWRGLGLVYFASKEYEKAVAPFKKALKIQVEVAGRDSKHIVNLYRELGLTYRKIGEYSKALDAFENALTTARIVAKKDNNAMARQMVKDHEKYVRSIKYLLRDSRRK